MNSRPRAFGASIKRKEDRRLLTGQGKFTDDLVLPGQTYAAFVRSPFPHARILSYETADAMEIDGAIAVYTGEDFAVSGLGPLQCGWMIHSVDGSPMRVGAVAIS